MNRTVKYLRYTLTLNAPTIVTTLSSDPNTSKTQLFIPGSAVRGALAGELLRKGVSADNDTFCKLILRGDVRFLHAYPSKGSVRSLPIPIPWRKEKGMTAESTHNLSAYTGIIDSKSEFEAGDESERYIHQCEEWPSESLTRVEFPFVEYSGAALTGVNVRTDARSHQQRDRVKGRSWKTTHKDGSEEAHGALFAYEYLEPGQKFIGYIQIVDDSDSETQSVIEMIKETLEASQILIGRSRRAAYGGAATMSFESSENHEASWGDVQRDTVSATSLFGAYLLSSCIAREPLTGQFDPCALPGLLVQYLGGEEVVSVERSFWDFETIGGFNCKWQLEVPQALAVKAGSTLIMRAKQAIPAATLRQIEHEGFGERRIEGFGRVVFLQLNKTLRLRVKTPTSSRKAAKEPSSTSNELVQFLQGRILKASFSKSLNRRVRSIVGNVQYIKTPTGSLLARLMLPLRNGNPTTSLSTLRQWLNAQDSDGRTVLREEALKKLRECRLKNDLTLLDWLAQAATPEAGIKLATSDELRLRKNQLGADHTLSEATAVMQSAEYSVLLIEAVLATLARQAQRENRKVVS